MTYGHTHASFGVAGGLGLPVIGKLLGHKQVVTTARYAHLDIDPQRRASEYIGGQLAAALGEARAASKEADVAALKRMK